MNNRRVWSMKWQMGNGRWHVCSQMTFLDLCRGYVNLWEGGYRDVSIRRTGVEFRY